MVVEYFMIFLFLKIALNGLFGLIMGFLGYQSKDPFVQILLSKTRPGYYRCSLQTDTPAPPSFSSLYSAIIVDPRIDSKIGKMDSILTVGIASVVLGALIAVIFFGSYLRKRTSEVDSMAKAEPQNPIRIPKSNPKKNHPKSHATDKVNTPPCISLVDQVSEFRDLDEVERI